MTAAIELTNEEFEELKTLTNRDDPNAAIRVATDEYVRYAKRMRLKDLSGRVQMDDNWRELENVELSESSRG